MASSSTLAFAAAVVVAVLLAGTFLITTQQGATATTTSTTSQSSTSIQTSGSSTDASQGLELQLSVNASSASGNVTTISIAVDEYNTLSIANNVSKGTDWGLQGLALGPCGNQIYPFAVALYNGTYTAGNVSQATPLRIYPVVPCPLFLRLVTGYLFQPASDLAVVLPSSANATATPMSSNVTATGVYGAMGGTPASSTPLPPGTYTVAAADEWGSVVLVHFALGTGENALSTSVETG
jgi:hypothetical protein